jgi:hypothetical protein
MQATIHIRVPHVRDGLIVANVGLFSRTPSAAIPFLEKETGIEMKSWLTPKIVAQSAIPSNSP